MHVIKGMVGCLGVNEKSVKGDNEKITACHFDCLKEEMVAHRNAEWSKVEATFTEGASLNKTNAAVFK